MKTIFYLSIVLGLLVCISTANGQTSNRLPNGNQKGKIQLPAIFNQNQNAVSPVLSPEKILLDSVYVYNWLSNDWSLNIKDYSVKDGTGRQVQNLFKKYTTGTGEYLDYVRFLYNYSGTNSWPSVSTAQLWYAPAWNSFQYTHYAVKDIPDTTYHKDWDNQHHRFSQGVKNTFELNDSLLPLVNTVQSWDTTAQDWVNTTKNTYTYTATMKPGDQVILAWQTSTQTWKNVYKYSDVYDGNDLLVSHLEYDWNDSASNWVPTIRISYYNNGVALPYLTVEELWTPSHSSWDSVSQTASIYNQYNWLMTTNSQVHLMNPGRWIEDRLVTYAYSQYGEAKGFTGSIWDTVHNTWVENEYQAIDS
jgi:hypothetical protein